MLHDYTYIKLKTVNVIIVRECTSVFARGRRKGREQESKREIKEKREMTKRYNETFGVLEIFVILTVNDGFTNVWVCVIYCTLYVYAVIVCQLYCNKALKKI